VKMSQTTPLQDTRIFKLTNLLFSHLLCNVPVAQVLDVCVHLGTAEAGFLQPDALSDANQIMHIWIEVRSCDACVEQPCSRACNARPTGFWRWKLNPLPQDSRLDALTTRSNLDLSLRNKFKHLLLTLN